MTSGSSNGRHEHEAGRLLQLVAMLLGVGVAVAEQDDLRPEIAHRLHLDLGRRLRHDDHRPDPELRGPSTPRPGHDSRRSTR